MTTIPKLKEMNRKELRKLARTYGIEVNKEMKGKELRQLIKKAMNNIDTPRSKEELIVDFIKSMVAIEEAMEPYKEQRKELKKQYKDNEWLDAKEQKRAIKAYKLLKDRENLDSLIEYCKEIHKQTGLGEE
jgi:hypothetical protein